MPSSPGSAGSRRSSSQLVEGVELARQLRERRRRPAAAAVSLTDFDGHRHLGVTALEVPADQLRGERASACRRPCPTRTSSRPGTSCCCLPRGRCCWRCRPAPPRRPRSPTRSICTKSPTQRRALRRSSACANRSRQPRACSSTRSLITERVDRHLDRRQDPAGDPRPHVHLGGELQRLRRPRTR